MAQKTNPIPKGYRSATPALVVRGAAAAIEYYTSVFGAEELSCIYYEDSATVMRAEIKIGNSILHLSDELPVYGILSPLSLGGASGSVQLFLDDLDAAWTRAMEAGATVVLPLEDTYWGERTGRIIDQFGHVWTLSKRIESVSKAELEKRLAKMNTAVSDCMQEVDDTIPTIDIRQIESQTLTDAIIANAS